MPLFEDSQKTIKHRHPNKSVGMGKITKINKHRAYVYSGVNSTQGWGNTFYAECKAQTIILTEYSLGFTLLAIYSAILVQKIWIP